MDRKTQALREIDKLDKIGIDGVCLMLGGGLHDTSGAFNKGIGLLPIEVGMIRLFLAETTGHDSNEETLASLNEIMGRLTQIRGRIDLMCLLEENVVNGTTSWDRLLAMPTNENNTWNGGRPKNIAWALDDLIAVIQK